MRLMRMRVIRFSENFELTQYYNINVENKKNHNGEFEILQALRYDCRQSGCGF